MLPCHRKTSIDLVLLAAVTALAYAGACERHFVYSETFGILQNRVVVDLHEFWKSMLTLKGMLFRPLSVFSYALNYHFGGTNPCGYHAVNVLVHIGNVILVYLLARRFFAAPLFSAALFALHPMATGAVSQIFGRNYSLGTLFLLLGLLIYLTRREQGEIGQARSIAAVFGCFVLAVLSKQTLAFFPLILLWHEVSLGSRGMFQLELRPQQRRELFLLELLVFEIIACLVAVYALPFSRTSHISTPIYIISQFAHVETLLSFYILPFQTAIVHDLLVYRQWMSSSVVFGMLFVACLIGLIVRLRYTKYGFLLGALLLSVLPSNSFLPKNEIIQEWRLYPSLVFFCLLMGMLVSLCLRKLQVRAPQLKMLFIALIWCVIALFGYATRWQNDIYRSRVLLWEQLVQKYPYSSDGFGNLGLAYSDEGNHQRAIEMFQHAIQIDASVPTYYINLSLEYRKVGDNLRADELRRQAVAVRDTLGFRNMSLHFAD